MSHSKLTPAAIEIVKNFVRDNIGRMSARECAAALGELGYNVSRNAIIGYAHRGGWEMQRSNKGKRTTLKPKVLKTKTATIRPRRDEGTFTSSAAAKPVEKALIKAFGVSKAPANPVTLSELNSGTCRWPLGEFAARPPLMFCGGPVFVGCYCMEHYQRSIQGKSKETKNGFYANEAGAGL